MSLNKAIFYGKEHRKPHYDSRRFDSSCCNHKSCGYCREGRLHNSKVRLESASEQMREENQLGDWERFLEVAFIDLLD